MAPKDPSSARKIPYFNGNFIAVKKSPYAGKCDPGGLEDRQIKYLSDTHEGKKHDKKVCDEEKIVVPAGSDLYQDTGFQGYSVADVTIHQPKKKPRGGELTEVDKTNNRLISQVRVVVEHIIAGVKRCRIVKDVLRNTQEAYDDHVMELACGLHNFRSNHRLLCY